MEDLGKSHATVKRLGEKLEDMQRMFQEEKGFFHKLEGNPQDVGERCDALEERIERLNKQHGMLEVQLRTLQISIELTKKTPVQLEMRLSGCTAQSEEEQPADERRNQRLDSAISEFQAQVLVKDACSALEVPWKAEIAQLKHSEESLAEQFEEIHVRSEGRCLTAETRVDCGFVPQLVGSRDDGPHTRMNTLQQALMERRSNADTRKPSPLIGCRGSRNIAQ